MPPRLSLEPEAEADLADAFSWYESQRPGLGSEFFAEVARLLTAIEAGPERYPIIRGETRRALVHRFPYAVFFVRDSDLIAVTAILHGRRDPKTWQIRRLT